MFNAFTSECNYFSRSIFFDMSSHICLMLCNQGLVFKWSCTRFYYCAEVICHWLARQGRDRKSVVCSSVSVLGFNSSEEIPKFTNHDISESNMRCVVCIKELWDYMSRKVYLLKELHSLVMALNKPDKISREEKYGVCKKIMTKLTDYFFTIIDLGTASFVN